MKLKQSHTVKGKLSSTLKSWLPILQTGITELEETLSEYSRENPYVDIRSNIQTDFTSSIPKKFYDRPIKNSVSEKVEALTLAEKSLYDVLYEQIGPPLFPTEISQSVAYAIIENLGEDGYYEGDTDEIAKKTGSDATSVEKIRARFAYIEPLGIGAKDVKEALTFQLENSGAEPEIDALCRKLIADFENMNRYKKDKNYDRAIKMIQSFRVPPAIEYLEKEADIIPDVFVYEIDGVIEVRLNDKFYPEIIIEGDPLDKKHEFVRHKIREAKDLVDALEMRKATLYKIGLMIVEYQYEFFMGKAIKPMKLKDLADEFGHAPSTISRAIANKYLECNRGILPLKSFFATEISEDVSNTAIKSYMENLVKSESKIKPLSDIRILQLIEKEFSISMVRRTITKYRKQLNIASSSERKKLYELSV